MGYKWGESLWCAVRSRRKGSASQVRHGVQDKRIPCEEGNWHRHFAGIFLISGPDIACALTNSVAREFQHFGMKRNESDTLRAYADLVNIVPEA